MSHVATRWISALALCASLTLAPQTTLAREEQPGPVEAIGVGTAAGVCTLVYTPVKIAYATVGLVLSGLVFLFSFGDQDATKRVARATAGGDYVVTPNHLYGKRSLRFAGESQPPDEPPRRD